MVSTKACLRAGLSALSGWRSILVLWFSATLPALPVVAALSGPLSADFGRTLAGRAVAANALPQAGLYWVDFLHRERPWRFLTGPLLFSAAATVLLQIFLAGGLVEVAGLERRPFLGEFFGACGRHFKHNVKCFVIFLALAALVPGLWLMATQRVSRALFRNAPPHTGAQTLYHGAALLVALLLFAWLSVAYDTARAAARFGWIGARRAWRQGLAKVLSRKRAALGIFFFWVATGGAVLAASGLAELDASARTAAAVAALALLEQAAIAARAAARVACWGSIVCFAGDGKVLSRERP